MVTVHLLQSEGGVISRSIIIVTFYDYISDETKKHLRVIEAL
jgi:hypothetical protein